MPVYVYQCDACGNKSEVFQHILDDSLTVCPACKEAKLQKVMQPVTVKFHGKGFYVQDNKLRLDTHKD